MGILVPIAVLDGISSVESPFGWMNVFAASNTCRHLRGRFQITPASSKCAPLRSTRCHPAEPAAMKLNLYFALLLMGAALLGFPSRGEELSQVRSGWAQSQRGLPLITSFEIPPTRHNGEIWAFATTEDGRLWIGSDELFLFDGKTREKVDLPFETYAVRALAHDDAGRLWVGAIDEIGHIEPTATGGWCYISAKTQLHAAGIDFVSNVWDAQSTQEGVVFVTDHRILRWNGSRFEHWELDLPAQSRLFSNRDRDSLWIFQPGVGLLQMGPEGPHVAVSLGELPGTQVLWTLTTGNRDKPGTSPALLICVADGIFLQRHGQWHKLKRLSAIVAGKSPWRATMLDGDTLAIGTLLGGVVIGSIDDEVHAVIDRASGLPNESISSLWTDSLGHLWTGYVGGMARIEAMGVASIFDSRNGFTDSPALKVISHADRAYILTRKALSVLKAHEFGQTARVTPVAQLEMPLSDVISIGPELWLSGLGGGIWRLSGNTLRQVVPASGYIFSMLEAKRTPYTLFYLHNTLIEALSPTGPDTWTAKSLSANSDAYSLNMVRDPSGDVWVATVTQGLSRFRLESDPDGQTRMRMVRHYRAGQGLPQPIERPQLMAVGDRIFLLSEKEILGYDRRVDAFNIVPSLNSFVAEAATSTDDPSVAYWIVRKAQNDMSTGNLSALIRLRVEDTAESPTWEPLDMPDLSQAGRISGLGFTAAEGGALWIAGSHSLVRLSIPNLSPPSKPPRLRLRLLERNGTAISLPQRYETQVFESDTSRLHFELTGLLRGSGKGMFVQASLSGLPDKWIRTQTEPVFEFTGLRPGDYTFRARALDPFGRAGPPLEFSFWVEAPWYQRGAAIVAYVMAGALLTLVGVRWRMRYLRRQNERLNKLVDSRTHELARANVVKNEFLENISHEIRNPLNGIANLVDLLRDAPLPPEERHLAQSLGRSTEHLKRVFSDVLGYTKLEYGHVNLEAEPFSLVQLLEDIVALFGVEARERKTELSLRLPAGFVDGFRGDPEKIRTIVSNYVSNALKYAPGAPVELVVTCTSTNPSGTCRVWIGVCDHGPGISATELDKLFRKFSRGIRAKASGISGTGLGLATCRGLAELMDGKADVSSEEGKGATFWIELPFERATPPTLSLSNMNTPGVPVTAGALYALIVDDQEYNQVVLRGIARRLGYEAEVASLADEVWLHIDQHTYAAVFLDWELPGPNGGEIARKLRDHPNSRNAVIVATTAHDTDDIRQQCLQAQMDGFVLKPFDTSRIRKVLDGASARRSGRREQAADSDGNEQSRAKSSSQLFLSAFADFAVGDPTRAQQAVSLYLEALEQELSALKAAIARDDREGVARQAHRVCSHSGLVNGTALHIAAQKLVTVARSQPNADWRPLCLAVFEEGAALKAAITSHPKFPTASE